MGRFEWKRRMGVHEAYHRNRVNRLLHWLCIPLELLAVVKLLSLVPLGAGLDLALVVLALVGVVYLLAEPLLGALMVAFLLGCWRVATLSLAGVWGAAAGVALFAVAFGVQVLVGHRVFEEGRDDTEKNLAELSRTRNPIPIVLVFFYHLVELALAAGYRPALARDIAGFTERELASWG